MKTAFIKLYVCLVMLFAISCTNDKLLIYEDVDRVYFSWANLHPALGGSPQIHVNLGYDVPIKKDSIINLKVNLMGYISDVDRPISAEIILDESTAISGEDIEILPSFIPAKLETGNLRIKLNNSKKVGTTTLTAKIRLIPNEYFSVDFTKPISVYDGKNALEFEVSFDAKTDMPSLWADPNSGVRLTAYFGKYSNTKLNVICEACGVTRDFFMHDPATENALDVLNTRIPTPVTYGMISLVNRYLSAYKAEHGEPMLDEYGEEIKTGLPSII